jgi:RecG-like helicase
VGDTITVTGTIKNYNGSVQFDTGCTMDKRISGGGKPITQETDPVKLVDMAYGLAENAEMAYDVTITGKVTEFEDAYTDKYKSISVVITVAGRETKPITLFGLKGDGITSVAVGDTVTAMGRLVNFYGTVEMKNCTMIKRVSGGGKPPVIETEPNKILAAGSNLANNKQLPYNVVLSGKVMNINEPYNKDYENITVTIAVDGTSQELKVYRLKGTGVEKIKMGDTITVEGRIKKYNDKLELVEGTLTKRVDGNVKVETDYVKIVDAAYALAQGEQLKYTATLQGKITALNSPYDAKYKNMTVTITVAGREDKPIECYRMKGDTIGNHLCVGDTITVEGSIKNYNGTIEFDAGCQMTARKAGSVSKPSDPKQIVDAAFALGKNEVLPYFATLTGTVKSIESPYDAQYKNVTLTMTVQGTNGTYDLVAYRMKGNDAATVAVGNTITVTGAIKNYVGTDKETGAEKPAVVEFDSGCVLESLQKSGSAFQHVPVVSEVELSNGAVQPRAAETNAAKIMSDAFALAENESLSYEATLTGKITSIKDPYNTSYKNISVIIEVPGYADKPMLCFRIKGDGAEKLAVGDTITVTGTIINFRGTVEFGAGSTLDKVVSGGGVAAVAPEDPKQIVDEAFALASGKSLPYSAKLTGKIVSVDGEYNEQYKNITVTIEVEGTSGKKNIECYRLKGTGADTLKVGDVIVVEGIIQRYIKTDSETGDVITDKVEFNAPSLIEINPEIKDEPVDPQPTGTKLYCEAAASWTECYIYTWDGSGNAQTGSWPGTLMTKEANGLWSYEIPDTAANVIFNNGSGSQTGDMTVPTDSKIKFVVDSNVWEELNVGGDEDDVPTTPAEIVDAAYGLKDGETLEGTYTLTGKIVSVDTPYDSGYKNITVTIKVAGSEDQPIKCYRLAGEGADKLLVDDTITVTGSLTNYKGSIQFAQGCTLDHVVSGGGTAPVAPTDPKQIVKEAYELEEGKALPYTATLTGVITEVGTYNETYGDITVKIVVEGKEFECYALKGENVQTLAVGDTITVTGTIKNYYGKVEFDKPTLDKAVKGDESDDNNQGGNNGGNNQGGNEGSTTQKTPAQIVAEAFALKAGESLSYEATLSGKITSVDYAYNATSGDITVSISVEGKTLKCYRMTGTGIDKIKVGDTITVKGKIKNYNGTVEFDKPVMVSVTTGSTNNGGSSSPTTGDYSLTGLVVIMVMAAASLVVLSKKKFYC